MAVNVVFNVGQAAVANFYGVVVEDLCGACGPLEILHLKFLEKIFLGWW